MQRLASSRVATAVSLALLASSLVWGPVASATSIVGDEPQVDEKIVEDAGPDPVESSEPAQTVAPDPEQTATADPEQTETPDPGEPEPAVEPEESASDLSEQSDPVPFVAQQDALVAPLAVGDATIRVRKAGDRLPGSIEGNQAASPLAGATFAAYRKNTSRDQSIPSDPPVDTCTTDANGICDLRVDSASERYLVVEQAAPPGWSTIEKIALGAFNASGTDRPYRWNVRVNAGQTTTVPETAIVDSSRQTWRDRPRSPSNPAYQWANVRANPELPADKCGLNIALLFDQSGSIGSNLSRVQRAATDFVDELTGTPTQIALFTFSTKSPQNTGNSRNRPNLVSIADSAGANEVKGYINGLSRANGGTNWDEGLRAMAGATPDYDLAIVLTDGNPTAWAGERSSTSVVNDYDVENAVHSANWLKQLGTRVIAIGFSGQAGGLTATNLSLISGAREGNPSDPKLTDDYFLTTFGELAGLLTRVALNNCGGTVNVQKRIAPTWAAAETTNPEPFWPFEAQQKTYVTPGNGVTGPSGEPVTFKVTFAPGELARPVTVSEPANHESTVLVPDAGNNARCFLRGQPLPADRFQNTGSFGFTVSDVRDTEIISCIVVNSDAQLQAVKYNDLNGNGRRDTGEPGLPGWTMFLDTNANSTLDAGERSVPTNAAGEALFDRLEAPKSYRVCEVLESGWFNTDPGGGAVCKTQQVNLGDAPAGPVLFGNIQAGGFEVSKLVGGPGASFIPSDTEFTIEVSCPGQPGYPKTLTLANGEKQAIGPLPLGTPCTVTETESRGADSVEILPSGTVTVGQQSAVEVVNTYPVGSGQVTKTVTLGTGLPNDLIPAGTTYPIEVRCTFPDLPGYPRTGEPIPGFNPLRTTVESGAPGQPGPAVTFGPLPVGSECSVTEPTSNGATEVDIQPQQPVTIPSGSTPVPVTIENIYEPAAIKIIKVVESATLPPSTEFVAQVQCTFEGEQVKNERVPFSVQTPGIVSNIPQGSTCEVTEVVTNGGVPTYSPDGEFPVNGPAVEVTVTNTFGTGDLVVTKAIDDNNTGLVPDGTSFTVDVACTFNGTAVPGFPQTATLTKPGSLSQTFEDIPVGAECTVTETNDAGAQNTIITPRQPVTITPSDQGSVQVTVNNVFRTDDFDVTKVVDDPSGRVPANTAYTVELRCTYPDAWPATGPIPGFNPKTLTLTASQTVSSGQLPVGAECSISETGKAGAVSNVNPGSVTVGKGTAPVTVTVTNTYSVGALDLRKAVDDGGTSLVPIGTEYTLRVECTYPAGFPVAGPIPGFSPLDVRVPSGSQGNPGAAVTVGAGGLPAGNTGLPVGSQCTVSEPDRKGAQSVAFTPSDTVTVTADVDAPVEVTATNTYPVGSGEVVKITDGPLAGKYAPAGSAFLVGITCTYPSGFPVSGPIPGYNPLVRQISAADPGQEGTPAQFGPVPLGSQCRVVEIDDGGATSVDIQPAQPITITDDQAPARVKVTNAYQAAGLQISKVVTGPGGALVPPDLAYTARVTCSFNGPDGPTTVFDRELDFGVGDTTVAPGPGAAAGLPVGSNCVVREVETNGATATVVPSGPFVVEGPEPVSVDVTVTNTFPAGQLTITKAVVGGQAALVPSGTAFSVGVLCQLNGSNLVGYPRDVTLTTPNQLSQTITGLPVGAVCFASETDTNGATAPPSFSPPGTEDFQSGRVTIVEQPQDPITITVTNTYPSASGQVVKVVDGPQAGVAPEGTPFTVQVACDLPADHPAAPGSVPGYPRDLTILAGLTGQPGTPVSFGPVPVGSTCTVTETNNGGATGVAIDPPQPVTIDDEQTPVKVTVTNTFNDGGLTVEKVVDGPGASLVPADTQYTARVACTFGGQTVYNQELPFGVGSPASVSDLPVGAKCTVTETNSQGAGTVTINPPDPVTIAVGQTPVEVSVTNTYPAGSVRLAKTVDGPLAGLAPEGTEFVVEVDCELPSGFPGGPGPVPGYPTAVSILAGPAGVAGQPVDVGPVPVGASCQVSELDSNGASQTVIEPSSFTIESSGQVVGVAVRNTYQPAALRIVKVLAGPAADAVPAKTRFTAQVTCVPPQGSSAPGFNGDVVFGVDDPGIVSGQPVGSECTVLETGDQGASGVSYAPAQTVTLTDDAVTPAQVTVTNTFEAGSLTVTKELAGAGAGFVPDGTVFTAQVRCEFAKNPVVGFNPWTVDLTPANPTVSSSAVGPLPAGAQCTVTETQDQGAASVDVSPVQPVTITPAGQGPVEVTVTNTFTTGELTVEKVLDGPGASLIPDGTVFTAQVACTYLGSPVAGFDPATVTLTKPGSLSATVGPLPTGAQCTVTETQDQGAANVDVSPSQPVTIPAAGQPPVEVTITNTFNTGLLTVEKDLTGSGVQFLPDGTTFTVEVRCTFAGNPVPGFNPATVDLTTPDRLVRLLDPLPIGAQCTVTETNDQGAQDVDIDPAGPVTIQNRPDAVRVRVTNTFLSGELTVTKVIDGPGAGFVPDGTLFTAEVSCDYLGRPVNGFDPFVVDLTSPDGLTQTVGPLPIGGECTVTETQDNGAQSAIVDPSDPVAIQGRDQGPVEVTITNTFETDEFTVTKVVDGDGAPFVPGGTVYEVEASCEYLGSPVSGFDPVVVQLTTPASLTQTVGPLPVGAECALSETQSNGAAMISVVPDSIEVGAAEGPAEVIVTNTYDTGGLTIEKVIKGPQGLVEGSFLFDVTCTFLGSELDPQPGTATITPPATSVAVDGIPVGADCTVAERAPYGGADGPAAVEPGSVTVGAGEPVTVTATNTFTPPPKPPQPPALAKTGAAGLTPLIGASVALLVSGAAMVGFSTRRRGRAA